MHILIETSYFKVTHAGNTTFIFYLNTSDFPYINTYPYKEKLKTKYQVNVLRILVFNLIFCTHSNIIILISQYSEIITLDQSIFLIFSI